MRLPLNFFVGLFTLLTIMLAGAAIGRLLGLRADQGAYFTLLVLAAVGWLVSRRMFRKGL